MKKNLLNLILATGILFSVPTAQMKKEFSYINQKIKIEKILAPHNIKNNQFELPKVNLSPQNYLEKKEVKSIIDSVYKKTKTILSKKEFELIAYRESALDANAQSKAGAKGIYQSYKESWEDAGMKVDYDNHVFNPRYNISAGIKYYSWLEKIISKQDSNWKNYSREEKREKLLAAFNWGIGNLKKNNWQVPDYLKETNDYIAYIEKHSKK